MPPWPIQLSSQPSIIPAQARAAGFSRILFYDDMSSLSTFDLSNTKATGFNWYIAPAWPNVASDTPADQAAWAAFTPTNPATFSLLTNPSTRSGKGVQNTAGATTSNIACATATYQAAAPGYAGRMFTPPFYAECSMTWNFNSGFGPPAFWFLPKIFLDGSNDVYYEPDIMESDDVSVGNLHVEGVFWNPYSSVHSNSFGAINTTKFVKNTFQTWGWLWKTMAVNSGTGLMQFYVDNILQFQVTYINTDPLAAMESTIYNLYISNLNGLNLAMNFTGVYGM